MDPFRDTARMLANQVLGHLNYDPETGEHYPKPHSGTGDPRIAPARMQVRIELESMIRGMCKQVWIDSAAVAQNAEMQIREAASRIDLEAEIHKAVAHELSCMRRDITKIVQDKIKALIDLGISDAIGDAPRKLANKIAGRMWDAMFGDDFPRKGWPSTFAPSGRGRGKRKR